MEELEFVEESVKGKIGQITRTTKGKIDIIKKWDLLDRSKRSKDTYESRNVSDDTFKEITECFTGMKKSKKFSEYNKHFKKLCSLISMSNNGLIIKKYKLEKRGDNKNYVYIKYINDRKRIVIPNGSIMIHKSTTKGIKELRPSWKARAGYFFSSPRVYFTINKNMSNFCADIEKDSEVTVYTPKSNIRTAFIDPLVPLHSMGAVYIETQFPIPVKVFDPPIKKKKETNPVKESANDDFEMEQAFASLEEFMEYYGLEFADDYDEIYEESLKSKVGDVVRHLKETDNIKKAWNNIVSKISNTTTTKEFKEKDFKKIKDEYKVLKETNKYGSYKKSYEYICKAFNLQPKDTTIRTINFDTTEDGKHKITISYLLGKRKILIPNGCRLVHISNKPGIKELIPSFCSKKRGYFMYPSKRVYFTINKELSGKVVNNDNTSTTYKYTPKENVRTAYIDAELPSYKNGCIYIDTQFPIPVEEINKKKKFI